MQKVCLHADPGQRSIFSASRMFRSQWRPGFQFQRANERKKDKSNGTFEIPDPENTFKLGIKWHNSTVCRG